ncbi:hypothetical protein HOD96_00505 [Candidatus Falkowbacteria bacterium]|mgnify:CR=1 FL=1|jgi:O-antigen ligase/tetratricopeptide (TPR) repeat protein|nr:hypothetical protein [Candidatus Falkowbacteria bacterium]MBT4433281.1 hypothetical protein [Candidatus Falkowbacteria bacterium]
MEKFLKFIIYLGIGTVAFVPIMMNSHFFFPFIFTKAFIFRITVEIMLLAFLLLASINSNYRPRLTVLSLGFLAYLIIIFISSFFGDNFYLSFWGDIERSEGLLTWIHLFVLFFIVSSVLKNRDDWLKLFDVSVFGSLIVAIFALGQRLNWDFILNAGENRLSATVGNPAFLATYLLFNVFFAIYLFIKRKTIFLKWYYGVFIAFGIYIIIETATRGAFVGLLVALFLGGFLTVFFTNTSQKTKKAFTGVLLVAVLFGLTAYFNKEAGWVQENEALRRMTNISLTDRTTETRFMTWNSAWQGVKEKPVLGWGQENFYLVFNKHFNPGIYEDAGSRIWFDRAHNVILDQAVIGGFFGLFAYLFMIFYPVYFFTEKIVRRKSRLRALFKVFKRQDSVTDKEKIVAIIFISLFIACFTQNLFVFDNVVTYIPLIFLLSFVSFLDKEVVVIKNKAVFKGVFIVFLILIIPIIYIVNIKPAQANLDVIRAMKVADKSQAGLETSYNLFLRALDKGTYGNQEYRARFVEFVDTMIYKKDGDEFFRREAALKAKDEMIKQIQERPSDVANYIILMRHYNRAYIYDVEFLRDIIEDLFPKALELSPSRPHIYYELGYAQINLGSYYRTREEIEKAEEMFDEGIKNFDKAIEINDRVIESYLNTILMLFVSDKSDQVQKYLNKMDELELKYKKEEFLTRMKSASINTKKYDWTIKFAEELVKVSSDSRQHFIDISLSYICLGEIDKAVEKAEKIKDFGPPYDKQAEEFIKQITSPDFDAKVFCK